MHNIKYGLSAAAQRDMAETEERFRSEQDHPDTEEEWTQTECKVLKPSAQKKDTADPTPDTKVPGWRYDMHGFFE